MELIPVIDLKAGLAVAARMGHRRDYAPLRSPLCRSAAPEDVAEALLGLYPFRTLYIADLDAIDGEGGHAAAIARLRRRHPGVTLWVDNGLNVLDRLERLARPVVGSESLVDLAHWEALSTRLASPILSLDFRGGCLVGPVGLDTRPDLWPRDVIVMTLDRVGSGSGPDFGLLRALQRMPPAHRVYAAGGVRHTRDLLRLRDLGLAGVLLSTALHRSRIPPSVIADLSASRAP
ncbi:HisA/HisF-related TIM barrel protein [Thiocapsa rosea]|uniref:Phosphoribosylformimino-5-aminoimidazole carboxamide ribotide isomerase n=1 Tax=Thiocapsa rosea TaxID=69360 RepID=A0A495VFC9_9GAMM|nr:HisA/HisF-related TIM barrel protein [Thiocapsa rosea]RKT47117.1 phosphoribosylformimino-5-aminoimidazole carboxamide ribotide isomerase [Thiocapsa rosea]